MLFRLVLVAIVSAGCACAYSVLSHEAIIDSAWDQSIRPILVQRFPAATDEDLRKAHAYAYGGAILQDLGYYPFGSRLFSDLVHYVRTGDFIQNLLSEAKELDEYAFAIGAMAHYFADNIGHPVAVNPSVALLYPKLRTAYGDRVTYEDNPADHLKMEFAFDVAQVAKGHYAPQAYHDFIGFEVSKDVLDRAFQKTYGLELKDVFSSVDLALGTYRRTISSVIPEMTKVAWAQKKKELATAVPGITRKKFVYNLSRASYRKEWGNEYERPGCGARLLGWVLRIVPKIGPFKALAYKPPTPEAEKLFMESLNETLSAYRAELAVARAGKRVNLPDKNLDTGKPTRAGAYRMADEAVSKLLKKLAERKFASVDGPLREKLLRFYGASVPSDPAVATALGQLREMQPANQRSSP